MADVIVRTAKRVRSAGRATLHEVEDIFTDPVNGRSYATRCGLTLSVGGNQAVLSTAEATCGFCGPRPAVTA